MARFKVDENLPQEVAARLRETGHDACTVFDESLCGVGDAALADVCGREERALVTLDMGFADICTYPPGEHSGIVVLRLVRQDAAWILDAFEQVIDALKREPLTRHLGIVEEQRIRIRGAT